ncbi:MAG: hypothetical protein NZ772_08360 [Cyanobacteria bacterium]|nr:hypothetical protein [Cyanobacteriota bacterium]MDW8200181.1 hypothetical protein [Cyanobacteriota bacterium SKYGB_h_bin112]
MVKDGQQRSLPNIQQLIREVINSGKLTRQEYMALTLAMLSNQRLSEDDRQQINRVFDNIQTAQIKIVDS